MEHTSILRSAFYNNDGVQHMNKGCYNDAIAAFTLSLEIIKPVFGCQNNGMSGSSNVCETTDTTTSPVSPNGHCTNHKPQHACINDTSSQPTFPCNEASVTHSRTTDFYKIPALQNNGALEAADYIFRDPIDIPIQSIARSRVTEKMVTKLSIVVMYNLGLSFHLSAVQENCLDRLTRARMLYEFAFEMHMEEGCDVTLLYTLALMNNLGLIYHLLGEGNRSHHCFQNMLSTMMFLLDADDAWKIKQWDGLLSNVLTYAFAGTRVSAPAA